MFRAKPGIIEQCKLLWGVLFLPVALLAGGKESVFAAEASGAIPGAHYYMQQYENAQRPDEEIIIDVTSFETNVADSVEVYEGREGSPEGISIGKESCMVTFEADVPETGLYDMELTYYPLGDGISTILFSVLIDGELPYTEAGNCILNRVFQNEEIRQDLYGNDIRPKSELSPEWVTEFLCEQTGVAGNLSFYLEEGKHEITLCFDESPMLLESFLIKQEASVLSYEDYFSKCVHEGYKETANVLEIFQAENYFRQSSSEFWPDYDRSSSLTQPFAYNVKKINYGGGSQWDTAGQWISWSVTAPEDGLYNIGIKYRQHYLDGLFSSREIKIDGEIPFKELEAVRFAYTDSWENLLLGSEEEPYLIYLTKGEHVITMKNVIGDMSSTIDVLQTVISNLNELYLSVIMITGSEPDQYRDYYLERQLPELEGLLGENAAILFEESDHLIEVVGKKGEVTAFIEDIAYNLESYAEDIEALTNKGRISNLKGDITGLSSKLAEYQQQALDIDYIAIKSSDQDMPKTRESVWEWLSFQIGLFKASFLQDKEQTDSETIRVWVNTGNDQFQIIEDMISDLFTPETGIEVELELVQGTLIQATATRTGPDVAINIDGDSAVNLALRGALVDLSKRDGYGELTGEYVEGSTVPFTVENETFAIPNSGSFSVMFVRTDIFGQLGLEIPTTWDEMLDVAQVLQRKNMSLGTVPGFATLLYQKGGSYFDDELTRVLFDEDVAVEAFTQYTDFYTEYGFPITYDFVTRFRSGEMPIGISSYSTYNLLKYSAPEISGLWAMYPIPGTVLEDGSIAYTQAIASSSGVTQALNTATITTVGAYGTIMFEHAENKDAAWEFIKWWSGAQAQMRYAKDLEAMLGVAARYNTLNLNVIEEIGWTKAELKILLKQIEQLEYVPIIPGNYYVTRGVENIYRGVVNNGENVRELLVDWTEKMNAEIDRKRREFLVNNK